jgi:hypothetical protein
MNWSAFSSGISAAGVSSRLEVIGHDHKVMQEKPPLSSILRKNIDQKLSHPVGLEQRATSVCRRGHEERTD